MTVVDMRTTVGDFFFTFIFSVILLFFICSLGVFDTKVHFSAALWPPQSSSPPLFLFLIMVFNVVA